MDSHAEGFSPHSPPPPPRPPLFAISLLEVCQHRGVGVRRLTQPAKALPVLALTNGADLTLLPAPVLRRCSPCISGPMVRGSNCSLSEQLLPENGRIAPGPCAEFRGPGAGGGAFSGALGRVPGVQPAIAPFCPTSRPSLPRKVGRSLLEVGSVPGSVPAGPAGPFGRAGRTGSADRSRGAGRRTGPCGSEGTHLPPQAARHGPPPGGGGPAGPAASGQKAARPPAPPAGPRRGGGRRPGPGGGAPGLGRDAGAGPVLGVRGSRPPGRLSPLSGLRPLSRPAAPSGAATHTTPPRCRPRSGRSRACGGVLSRQGQPIDGRPATAFRTVDPSVLWCGPCRWPSPAEVFDADPMPRAGTRAGRAGTAHPADTCTPRVPSPLVDGLAAQRVEGERGLRNAGGARLGPPA